MNIETVLVVFAVIWLLGVGTAVYLRKRMDTPFYGPELALIVMIGPFAAIALLLRHGHVKKKKPTSPTP